MFQSTNTIPDMDAFSTHNGSGKTSVIGEFFVMDRTYAKRTPQSEFLGKTFNYLTILKEVEQRGYVRMVEAKCKCGTTDTYALNALRIGRIISCGCYANELRKIKRESNPVTKRLRKAYYSMLRRCYDKNSRGYKNYGGRNISVCDEWKNSCYPFYDWAIRNGYTNQLTLDRIENNGNYEPSNCRWATVEEQARNRRSNIVLSHNGFTRTAVEWADALRISPFLIYKRHKRGWTDEEILTIPNSSVRKLKRKYKNYI